MRSTTLAYGLVIYSLVSYPSAPPITSPPAPEKAKDQAPLLSPSSTPTPSQPSKFSSPTTSPGIAPYVPPSASQGQPPPTKDPELAPEDPGKQLNNN